MSKWVLCMWYHINTYYRMEEFIISSIKLWHHFRPFKFLRNNWGRKKAQDSSIFILARENKFPYWVCFARILLINSRDYIHETVLNCVWRMTIWGFRSRYLLFFCATVTSFFSIQLATLRHSCYHGFSAPLEYNVFGSWDQISYLTCTDIVYIEHCDDPPLPSSCHLWDSLFQMYTIKQTDKYCTHGNVTKPLLWKSMFRNPIGNYWKVINHFID